MGRRRNELVITDAGNTALESAEPIESPIINAVSSVKRRYPERFTKLQDIALRLCGVSKGRYAPQGVGSVAALMRAIADGELIVVHKDDWAEHERLQADVRELAWAAQYGGHEPHVMGNSDWAYEQRGLQAGRKLRYEQACHLAQHYTPQEEV